jgi:ectoine hydroxylase-related dioxygenase (phytanoyl-CoA dioxygenase family)
MAGLSSYKSDVMDNGFTVIHDVFSFDEVNAIIREIERMDSSNPTFRKTDDLFAIRQFLKEVPNVQPLVLTNKLMQITSGIFGNEYFVVKSIYFDKPEKSNWFVAYHQDLIISVDKKEEVPGFGPWTVKQNQFAVQPPLYILQDNFTVRIHLDDTDETNGALKVIPKSHNKGVYRAENIDWNIETETICNIPKGGIMIMRPLLLHASNRTISNKRRRVAHIEFSKVQLPAEINWSELI